MKELGDLTIQMFSKRIGCHENTVNRWLLPSADANFKEMDDAVGALFVKYLRTKRTPLINPTHHRTPMKVASEEALI